jgi:uncharacterized protein YgiM (DUF1202 family)
MRKRIFCILILSICLLKFWGCAGTTNPNSIGTPAAISSSPLPSCEVPAPYVALPLPRKIYVIEDNVPIQEGAGEHCYIISHANRGDALNAVGKKGAWFHVNLADGQQGFINETTISNQDPNRPQIKTRVSPKPITPPIPSTPEAPIPSPAPQDEIKPPPPM